MREAVKKLSKKQLDFICSECSISKEELDGMDEEQIYDIVYDTMCDIEVEEVCKKDALDDDSERCDIASDIVTIRGNAMAEKDGFYEKQKKIYY